jgi:hypothetical protein
MALISATVQLSPLGSVKWVPLGERAHGDRDREGASRHRRCRRRRGRAGDPAPRQFVLQCVQRQMRRLVQSPHDESPMRIKNRLAVAAHLARLKRARQTEPLRPLHHHDTATPNRDATARQLSPSATAETTRLRKSLQRGRTIRCWPPGAIANFW